MLFRPRKGPWIMSVEPKVRLQGYGYNPFCSHSSRCLAVLVWQYFEEACCAPKVRLKWDGFEGFPSHSSHCSGGLFPQYSGVSPLWHLIPTKQSSSTAKLRIWTLQIWGVRGAGFLSVGQVLCGDASSLFLDHFSLGRHVCRTKTAPEKLLNRYKKRFEKCKKRSEKRTETCLKYF